MKNGIINNGACCAPVTSGDTPVPERSWNDIKAIVWPDKEEVRWLHISQQFRGVENVSPAGVRTTVYQPVYGMQLGEDFIAAGRTYTRPSITNEVSDYTQRYAERNL